MIMGNVVQGPWGESILDKIQGFSQGVDYNCKSTICYGITKAGEKAPGAVHEAFVALQRAINRWSGKGNFPPIATDGKIGAGTVSALKRAGEAALEHLPVVLRQMAQSLFSGSLTKENAARFAMSLTKNLNEAADKLQAVGSLPPPKQTTLPPKSDEVATTASTSQIPSIVSEEKSSLVWWLLGGFAAVAVAGVVTVAVVRRRRIGAPATSRSMSHRPGRRQSAAF
jgi:lysozyme family protein